MREIFVVCLLQPKMLVKYMHVRTLNFALHQHDNMIIHVCVTIGQVNRSIISFVLVVKEICLNTRMKSGHLQEDFILANHLSSMTHMRRLFEKHELLKKTV